MVVDSPQRIIAVWAQAPIGFLTRTGDVGNTMIKVFGTSTAEAFGSGIGGKGG